MSLTTTDKNKLNDCLKMAEVAEQAISVVIAIKKENDDILAKFNVTHAFWEGIRSKYITAHDNWRKRINEFSKYADYENPQTKWHTDCVKRASSSCTTRIVSDNTACANKFGNEFIDTGNRQGCGFGFTDGCMGRSDEKYSRGQKRQCARDPIIINKYKNEYIAAEPILPEEPKYGAGAFPIKPTPPINIAMACCSNTMILSGNVNAKDNVQSCSMQIKQELARQTATEKAVADKLAADKLAADKLAADKLAADKLAADKLAADKLAADKLAADKIATGNPTTNNPATNNPATNNPTTNNPTTNNPATNDTPASTLSDTKETVDKPTTDNTKSKKIIYAGGGFLFLLCSLSSCCVFCLIILALIMILGKSNEN